MRNIRIIRKTASSTLAVAFMKYESWQCAHAAGGVVMGADILQQFPVIRGLHTAYSAPLGNDCPGSARGLRARGVIPSDRMRLLHFENAFGDVYASEYCLDAMLSLVLLVMRSTRLDADRLERLTAVSDAACPADDGFLARVSDRPERRLECLL